MRMRRITAVLLALMLMVATAAAEKKETAVQLRFEIENRYHVSVLMGEECLGVPTSGFELQITPQGPSLFHWLYIGEEQYTEALKTLRSALSAYPEGFFRNFRSAAGDTRLQFLVGDRIIRGGQSYGAMTASDNAGHSSVFLAADATNPEASVHHALWHVIEARILFKESFHFIGISCKNDNYLVPMIFHFLDDSIYCLITIRPVSVVNQRICLINKEDSAHRLLNNLGNLLSSLAHVTCHHTTSVSLYHMTLLKDSKGLIYLTNGTCNGCLTCSRISCKHKMS